MSVCYQYEKMCVCVVVIVNDEDNDDDAYKIVHLGEILWSREFECAGKLHNLTNVDTSILRRGIDSYYLVKYYPETVRHLSSGHVSS